MCIKCQQPRAPPDLINKMGSEERSGMFVLLLTIKPTRIQRCTWSGRQFWVGLGVWVGDVWSPVAELLFDQFISHRLDLLQVRGVNFRCSSRTPGDIFLHVVWKSKRSILQEVNS